MKPKEADPIKEKMEQMDKKLDFLSKMEENQSKANSLYADIIEIIKKRRRRC